MTTLAGDRDLRAVVVTGAGSAFCSGGDTSWIAGDPDATLGRPAAPDAALLPRLAVDPRPRRADDRRGQRPRDRRGPVSGAGVRPAVRGERSAVRCAVRPVGHAPGHGRHLAAARGGRRGPRARPAADRAHRRGRRGAADRPGLPRGRARAPARGGPGRRRADRGHRSARERAHHAGAARPAATPTWRPRCSGRRWPNRSPWPPTTSRRGSGPPASVGLPGSPGAEPPTPAGPGPGKTGTQVLDVACLPLANVVRRPGAPSGEDARRRLRRGQHKGPDPAPYLWTTLWTTPGRPVDNRWNDVAGLGTPCGAGPARGLAQRPDQRQCRAPGVEEK